MRKLFVLKAGMWGCLGFVAAGCVEPPPPTATTMAGITITSDGCPQTNPVADVARNDKISWYLMTDSVGYAAVEAFGVAFTDSNPTYCVNATWVNKGEDITCTIKVDARTEPVCYTLSTRFNGGQQTCERRFALRIDGDGVVSADLCNAAQ